MFPIILNISQGVGALSDTQKILDFYYPSLTVHQLIQISIPELIQFVDVTFLFLEEVLLLWVLVSDAL